MNQNKKLGGILATFGGLFTAIGTMAIFLLWYERGMTAEAAEPGCEMLLKYIMPTLGDMAMIAGLGYMVSGYLFFTGKKGAFGLAVISNMLALQGSWFINVPFMSASMPPVYFIVFVPNLILYFLILRKVGNVSWGRTVLGMFTGMAFVLCFMNGIASWSRILTIGTPLFVFVQRLHWISSIGWGIVTAGILIAPKDWMRVVGLAAGLLQLVVGTPLAIETTIELGRFSLFSIAPIISGVMFFLYLSPKLFQRMTGAEDEEAIAQTA